MSAARVTYLPRPDFVPREEMQLANRIAAITADFERPKLRVVDPSEPEPEPRPMDYWRRYRNEIRRRQLEEIRRCRKK